MDAENVLCYNFDPEKPTTLLFHSAAIFSSFIGKETPIEICDKIISLGLRIIWTDWGSLRIQLIK